MSSSNNNVSATAMFVNNSFVRKELQQDRTTLTGQYDLIASLCELTRCHCISDVRFMYGNRILVSFPDIGSWILYANTGTCFTACTVEVGQALHTMLSEEGIVHTARMNSAIAISMDINS